MTPRERAEALGWVTDDLNWYDSDERWLCGSWRDCWRAQKRAQPDIIDAWLALNGFRKAGEWLYFPTEDEALAHALLLRDVVLS